MMPYTSDYVLPLLERAIADRNDDRGIGGATRVATELGAGISIISQLRSGSYPKSSCAKWYLKIVQLYGSETLHCPTLGVISLNRCTEEKGRPAAAPNSDYVRQRRACSRCQHSKGSKGG